MVWPTLGSRTAKEQNRAELSNRPMLKPFLSEKIVPSKWGPNMAFWGKMGVQTLDFGFATPKRHQGTAPRHVTNADICLPTVDCDALLLERR